MAGKSKYLVLIYEREGVDRDPALDEEYAKHWSFIERRSEQIVAGEALQPTATATSIRLDGAEPVVTDGPFVETKEALGGFYLLEAADLDEALALAREIPAPNGGLEIRPVLTFENREG